MKSVKAFSLFVLFLAAIGSNSYAALPTTAKGMWIWQIWTDESGNLDSIISKLKTSGVTWVAVKLGDSNSPWNSPGHDFYTWSVAHGGIGSIIIRFHNAGIKFFGWQYVYGASQYSGSGTTPTEAGVTNEILDIPGVDGFIIDAEVEFEASGMTSVAAQYVDSIRAAHPNSFVALTSFARVTGQPMPWTTFLQSCDANMPQAYWALRPTDPVTEFSAMRNDFESWEQTWINEGYTAAIKPIVPIGCENSEGETSYQMHYGDIQQFAGLSQSAGYAGMSLWEYAGMDTMNWRDYAAAWENLPPVDPQITSFSPSITSNVPTYDSIKINFNSPMDAPSVYAAFSINPTVKGTLGMTPDFTQWTFVPDTLLGWSTTYTVTLDTTAASLLGVHIVSPYLFRFTTVPLDRTPPVPLAVSPQNGGTSSLHAYFEFIMNKPVTYNSFASRVSFVDPTGKKISLAKDLFQITPNNLTLASFRPTTALTPGMKYTASVAPGVVDYYGNSSKVSYSIAFTIDTAENTGGSVIENFESSSSSWVLAQIGNGTVGVDTALTRVSIQSNKTYDGNYALGLQYSFDSTNGICAVENTMGFDISAASSFGMWIFGDNSGNELDFIFGPSSGNVVPIDTINWYGWKFISMWRDKSDITTDIFKGFSVRSLQTALLNGGSLYVDDMQIDGKITGIRNDVTQPLSFELFQNYPNPFNPASTIEYRLPMGGHVSLKVYDVLGREVRDLVDEQQGAGDHHVTFYAGSLPSGVYFYRIIAGGNSGVKKMIVVK